MAEHLELITLCMKFSKQLVPLSLYNVQSAIKVQTQPGRVVVQGPVIPVQEEPIGLLYLRNLSGKNKGFTKEGS